MTRIFVTICAILVATIWTPAIVEAAIVEIPPLFRENPNARSFFSSPEGRAPNVDNYRLPNATEPLRYNIVLTTNIHNGDLGFVGVVNIELNVVQETESVVLHARQLSVNNATIKNAANISSAMSINYEKTTEFLTLTPVNKTLRLKKGEIWMLTIQYNGTLRNDNGGFYVSTYLDEQKRKRYLATTQFESTDARHAFPCFDEPAKRAIFSITINHDSSYSAISNMPVKTETVKGNRKETVFHDTPAMSTYLIAFIISDFTSSKGMLNNLPQRVFSRRGTEHDQEFALVSGMLIVERLAKYYNVPFSLPKLDQVAVPDFASGAMENWGLATYREQYLLYNKQNSTVQTQTNIANIISHEFCHQWFGNLVAIKWWTYLWLKEGFATTFSYKATDEAYPEWDIMQLFHAADYQSALRLDIENSVRPMTSYVQTPKEIRSKYDTISYAKAGSVLFMWQHALTDKVFQRGLHNYLEKNKYSAAEQDDLFSAIQAAADDENYKLPETIKTMMASWTMQRGYPLLSVERFYNGSFRVTQEAYFEKKQHEIKQSWFVPINYAVKSTSNFRLTEATHYLRNVSSILIEDNISNDDWLIINKQSTGYYRVNYDKRNWHLITEGLRIKAHKVHPRNRAQLLDDAYRLTSTGRLDYDVLLTLMTYLKSENQYAPWSTAYSILATFNRFLRGDTNYNDFLTYVAELVENIYDQLGINDIDGEQHLQKYTRSVVINLACMAGIRDCLEETNKKLVSQINDGIAIEPNLQNQVYCNGLKRSSDREFDHVYNNLMSSENQANRISLITALGCAEDPAHIRKFIESSISVEKNNTLRTQERTILLQSSYSRSVVGLLECIDFLDKNWETYGQLTAGFGGSNPLDIDIRQMSIYVTNTEQEKKLLDLVGKVKNSPYVTRNLEDSVNSTIKNNFDWLEKNRDPLMNWIIDNRNGSTNGSDNGASGHGNVNNGAVSISVSVISGIIISVPLIIARFNII